MNSVFDASSLQSLFEKSFANIYSGALVDADGNTLFLKYQNLSDIGTFPAASLTSDQYIQIQNDDFVILNDPYSGGTVLSSVTIVMGIDLSVGPRKTDNTKLLLSSRLSFKPRVVHSKSIEDEGVRIPPSPLKINGQWNQELFQFMDSHPKVPQSFKSSVIHQTELMLECRDCLINGLQILSLKLNKKSIQKFINYSYQRAQLALSDLTNGEKLIERPLADSKEKLAIRVEIQDEKVLFDFTNSTNSKHLHLTDAATIGACAGSLFSTLDQEIPVNAGTLKIVEVITPKGSMVNAKYPEPVFLGLTDGVALIAVTVIELIGQIDSRKVMAQNGFSQCSLEVDFESGPHFFEFLESGVAAGKDRPGVSALDLWKRSHLMPSIESAESLLPIKVLSNSYRQNSGGSGLYNGGDGATRSIQVLQSGRLTWMISPPISKPEGINGGKAASPTELFIVPPGQSKIKLEPFGSQSIERNTVIIMNSAGGGGVGEPHSEEHEN